jgi:hypothetical protein
MKPPLVPGLLLALGGCAALPQGDAPVGVQQAWVQAVARPAWAVRALTADVTCPTLRWPGGSAAMQPRSAPGVLPPPPGNAEPLRKPTRFTLSACEATWPAGVSSLAVGSVTLQAPAQELRRIVVLGDTGCRLKASAHAFQGCNNTLNWPFARVLARALELKPDLVVHVGDYHYRESPCPAAMMVCAHSPWGYGDDTWQADFFQPAQALLAAAPWVFVRGNHEACSRAGQGWLRYLDAEAGPARACAPGSAAGSFNDGDFTAPFAVPLSTHSQLIVFDSAEIGSRTPPRGSTAWARWREQLEQVAALSAQATQSLFVSHHPSLAVDPAQPGAPTAARSGLTPLLLEAEPHRMFAPGVQATLHGHLHMFQALGFASNHPITLVVGNGGSETFSQVDDAAALKAELMPGAVLETVQTHTTFGFTLLTATPQGWALQAFNTLGQPLASCTLAGQTLRC